MTPQPDAEADLPRLYTARDVATALGVSEWWIKNEARHGRIPCLRPAGQYRFTADHYAEIVAKYEQRVTPARVETTTPRRRPAAPVDPSVVQLVARPPRRARKPA